MPAKSKKQQEFMAMAAHGKLPKSTMPDMPKEKMMEFARTPKKGLPVRVKKKKG